MIEARQRQHPSKKPTAAPSVRVTRVTLPRYEVEFRDICGALAGARQIRQKKTLMMPHELQEGAGAQILLDLSVHGLAFSISLIFRVIMSDEDHAVVEWWARRKTDPALLDLWINALETYATSSSDPKDEEPTPETVKEFFDICRRALSKNPFVALGIHWSSSPAEVREARRSLMSSLHAYTAMKGLNPHMKELLDQAMKFAPGTISQLSDADGRRKARGRFVPANQRRHALNLLRSKLDVAILRGQDEAVSELRLAMMEL
jgi:hypothetical protein